MNVWGYDGITKDDDIQENINHECTVRKFTDEELEKYSKYTGDKTKVEKQFNWSRER